MDEACSMKMKRTGNLEDLDINGRNNAGRDLKGVRMWNGFT
jgi:hypothetical protein